VIVFLLILTYGGLARSTYGGHFYQTSLYKTIPAYVPGACLLDQYPTANRTDVLERTVRLAQNHRIILWSETAVEVDMVDEEEFLANVSAIAETYNTFIGATYLLQDSGESPNQMNMVTLISDSGEVLFRYQKSHPVPFVEASVRPGPGQLYTAATELGRVSAAICFDMNFPWTIVQAGRNQVDLLLQPSWTWGPLGQWHAENNAVRAVEMGFTTFRCSSVGYSGVWSANGETLFSHPGLYHVDIENIEIPIRTRSWTWYGLFGDMMPWICVAIGVLLYLPMAFLPLVVWEKVSNCFPESQLGQRLLPLDQPLHHQEHGN